MAPGDWVELAPLIDRPEWHRRAACRGAGPDAFYPRRGDPRAEARDLCSRCPVIAACGQAGADEQYGTWGGATPQQRRAARRAA